MSEQIHISEVDETGAEIAAAEIEAELTTRRRFNPWLIALWVICAVCLLLFVLGMMGTPYSYQSSYNNGMPAEMMPERPWYATLTPFAWPLLVIAFLIALSTLITQAVFWERHNRYTRAMPR